MAFTACVFHHSDIGGRVSSDNREVFEEGLFIPLVKLYDAGVLNEDVLRHDPLERAHPGGGDRRHPLPDRGQPCLRREDRRDARGRRAGRRWTTWPTRSSTRTERSMRAAIAQDPRRDLPRTRG
ncbi:MAG: hydantoinase B/oxoprolinase family protein [Comamonadaceae bacterium]|nr:hydantoinase B/oxoprolinase family protein [Comamonadaceae bacterium]